MIDSLLLNTYELIGAVTDPWVQLEVGYDIGEPVPDLTVVVGMLLDGDRVTGSRSANRTVTLPLTVTGTTRIDMAANVNKLIALVDAGAFTLQWTPNGGLPVVLDCYRGSFERVRVDVMEQQFFTTLNLSFTAAPFGRSTTQETVTVSSPQLQVDSMDASTPPTGTTRDTTNKYEGAASAAVVLTRGFGVGGYSYAAANASRTITAVDLSSYASLGVRFHWVAPSSGTWTANVNLLLSDGTHTSFVTVYPVSVAAGSTAWQLLTFSLSSLRDLSTGGASLLNLAAVTSWQLTFATDGRAISAPPSTSSANWDDLRAFPPSSSAFSTTEGTVLTVPAVKGTARTPVSLAVSHSPLAGVFVHRPPVTQSPDAEILGALSGSPKTKTIAAANNTFKGTYAVWLLSTTLGSGTRTVTVTFDHQQVTTSLKTQAISVTYIATSPALAGKFLSVGEITLPLLDVPAENNTDRLVITVTSSGGTADTFADVMLVDTTGQTVVVGSPAAGTTVVYVDEPDPAVDIGQVYASATDRTAAAYALGNVTSRAGGGPMLFEPGDNRVMAVSPSGAPDLTASYYPRVLDERDV